MEFDLDPLFQKNSIKFDDASYLLLGNLKV